MSELQTPLWSKGALPPGMLWGSQVCTVASDIVIEILIHLSGLGRACQEWHLVLHRSVFTTEAKEGVQWNLAGEFTTFHNHRKVWEDQLLDAIKLCTATHAESILHVGTRSPGNVYCVQVLLPSGKRGKGSCSVGWKSELAYVCTYIYMSVTLKNAVITTYVDMSRTRTVSTWPTGDARWRLCRLRVQRHWGRADEASTESARTVDPPTRSSWWRSPFTAQRLIADLSWMCSWEPNLGDCRTETPYTCNIFYNVELSNYLCQGLTGNAMA